jgi:hypothetical protein
MLFFHKNEVKNFMRKGVSMSDAAEFLKNDQGFHKFFPDIDFVPNEYDAWITCSNELKKKEKLFPEVRLVSDNIYNRAVDGTNWHFEISFNSDDKTEEEILEKIKQERNDFCHLTFSTDPEQSQIRLDYNSEMDTQSLLKTAINEILIACNIITKTGGNVEQKMDHGDEKHDNETKIDNVINAPFSVVSYLDGPFLENVISHPYKNKKRAIGPTLLQKNNGMPMFFDTSEDNVMNGAVQFEQTDKQNFILWVEAVKENMEACGLAAYIFEDGSVALTQVTGQICKAVSPLYKFMPGKPIKRVEIENSEIVNGSESDDYVVPEDFSTNFRVVGGINFDGLLRQCENSNNEKAQYFVGPNQLSGAGFIGDTYAGVGLSNNHGEHVGYVLAEDTIKTNGAKTLKLFDPNHVEDGISLSLELNEDPDQNTIQLSYYDNGEKITFMLNREGVLLVSESDEEFGEVDFD